MASKARLRARARQVVGIGLLIGALYAGWTHRKEIHHALNGLGHPEWGWLLAACTAQAGSMVVFARLQRWLLRCGGVRVRLRDMVEITLAGNALSTSLPGGAAWSAGWMWGQLRRRSVDRVLAGWVVIVAGAISSFALFVLVVVGAEIAGSSGPVASLRWVDRVLVFLVIVAAAAIVGVARSARLRRRWEGRVAGARASAGGPVSGGVVSGGVVSGGRVSGGPVSGGPVSGGVVSGAPGGGGQGGGGRWARVAGAQGEGGRSDQVVRALDTFSRQVRIVSPTPLAWVEALLLGLANWGEDLATLIFCIWTVHASVPWRGVVISYALTQIAASIPVTPGGLAVVEASLAALLVGYGMPSTTAVTVVLLYRLISFWCLVPIGWGSWGLLEWTQSRSSSRHHPWAFHRHRPGSAAGAGVEVGAGVGVGAGRQPAGSGVDPQPLGVGLSPERFVVPSDCEGCDEPVASLVPGPQPDNA